MRLTLIPLRLTRYSDSQNILSAYSRQLGRVSLTVAAGRGRGAARVKALTMPLSVIECEVQPRPGRELMPMSQVRPVMVLPQVHSNPVKQMLAMFLAEVLATILEDGGADEGLFDYVTESVRILDGLPGRRAGNFHICFLLHLGRHLGIEPDISTYCEGGLLDVAEGIWRRTMPLHGMVLDVAESAHAAQLMRMTYGNMHVFRYTREQRARVLDGVMDYYSRHVMPLRHIRSLEVLRAMS